MKLFFPNDDAWIRHAHDDAEYFQGSLNAVTVWIPLQDIDSEIGPLDIFPGSHKNGSLNKSHEGELVDESIQGDVEKYLLDTSVEL